MKIDDKAVAEIAKQLGLDSSKREVLKRTKGIENMGDKELVEEILKVKNQLSGSNVSKEKQLEAIRSLLPLMNEEQKTRLAKLIELLEA